MTPRRALLAALTFAAALALILMAGALPSGADYSDHGEPVTSLVASTHPGQPTDSGLAVTGSDIIDVGWIAVFAFAVGAALVAAAQLAQRKRGRR